MNRNRSSAIPLLVAWLLAGCVSAPPATINRTGQPAQVWPPAPEPPRIAYLGSFQRPSDVGVNLSGFTRLHRWLSGSVEGNEPLSRPFGISTDEEGNVALTDTAANTVSFHDRTRSTWTRWRKVGSVAFKAPVAVAHSRGTFYVADAERRSIIAFDKSGRLLFETTNHLERPSGLVLTADRVIVTDAQRHRVVTYDRDGRYVSEFGRRGSADGELNHPTHIAADSEGRLYVTDSMNGRIQILAADGRYLGSLGSAGDSPGHFGRPKGVAIDSLGHIYVVDGLFDNIQIFDRSGRLLLVIGGSGSKPGEFWLPNGIATGRGDEIYATDGYNHRVQVFKYIGSP